MNGTIEVESDMGLGTEFTITIPMKYIIKNTNTKLRENVLMVIFTVKKIYRIAVCHIRKMTVRIQLAEFFHL